MEFMTVEEIKGQLDYNLQNTVKQTSNNYVWLNYHRHNSCRIVSYCIWG